VWRPLTRRPACTYSASWLLGRRSMPCSAIVCPDHSWCRTIWRRPRIIRRACRGLPWGGSIWSTIRVRLIWWNGGLRFALLLQVLLIFIVARLVFAWWQRRDLAASHSYAGARPARGYGFGGFRGILNSTRDQLAGEPLTIAKWTMMRSNGRWETSKLPTQQEDPFGSAHHGHSRDAVLFLRRVGG
jgi:hypothetical protein